MKTKAQVKQYKKEWYLKNKQFINTKSIIRNRIYRKIIKPWFVSFDKAKQRCINQKNKAYKYYGGKGIKFLMTLNDFEFLWFRDKAYLMKKPSIDRINSNSHYELNNCQFIEKSKNSSKANIKKVQQFSLAGKFIKNWNSLIEIARNFNVTHSTISHSIKKGKYRGYLWKKI